jgi:hypothetical protein
LGLPRRELAADDINDGLGDLTDNSLARFHAAVGKQLVCILE